MRIAWKIFVGILAVTGLLSLSLVATLIWLAVQYRPATPELPKQAILEMHLAGGLPENRDGGLAAELFETGPSLRDVLDAFEVAGDDATVKAVYIDLSGGSMPMAQAQELRGAIKRFRDTGKPVLVFADSYDGIGGRGSGYYLATAADEVWLQPSGDININGFALSMPFAREALAKIGVEARFDQREEFKGIANIGTDTELPQPLRTSLQAVADGWLRQLVSGIAADRGLDTDRVRALVDSAPPDARQAEAAGLIDRAGYRDQIDERLDEIAGDDAERIGVRSYLRAAGRPHRAGTTVAVVYGVGEVVRRAPSDSPFAQDGTMAADRVGGAIRAAVDDPDVKAILFRVDSPGGSYIASDTIWREVVRARENDKKVVVSMGATAASGGYFVSMPADRIYAQPGTLTGSIGVAAGKILTRDLWAKLGVNWQGVKAGANADMWSMNTDFSADQWQRFQDFLDRTYDDFVAKAAEGRGMTADEMRRVAKGRVWTGSDARDHGLVDELGGFYDALSGVREVAGLEADEPIELRTFPRPGRYHDLLQLAEQFAVRIPVLSVLLSLESRLEPVRPLIEDLGRAIRTPDELVLRSPVADFSH